MNRQLLQQALEALEESVDLVQHDYDADWRHGMPTRKAQLDASLNALTTHRAAIAALREALNAPEPEPVALESVHLTRDTRGMCVVRVNGKIAIRDNGDIIDHMATLEWFAAPPAAPIPDGMVMVPREPTEEMIQAAAGAWGESESGLHNAFAAALRGGSAAAPAAPVVREPLTDKQILSMWRSSKFRGNGGQADWFCEGIRAAEAHHGITGASK